jgi:hypothetical protein
MCDRKFYFQGLDESTVFVSLPTPSYARSVACFDEFKQAHRLKKPMMALMLDYDGWQAEAKVTSDSGSPFAAIVWWLCRLAKVSIGRNSVQP